MKICLAFLDIENMLSSIQLKALPSAVLYLRNISYFTRHSVDGAVLYSCVTDQFIDLWSSSRIFETLLYQNPLFLNTPGLDQSSINIFSYTFFKLHRKVGGSLIMKFKSLQFLPLTNFVFSFKLKFHLAHQSQVSPT